jgi:hypothetical protein
MTPSEKAHDTRVFRFARAVVAEINSQPDAHLSRNPRLIVDIFDNIPASKRVKADAYVIMDGEHKRFGPYTGWHAALRGCRNHPIHGPELFSLFN